MQSPWVATVTHTFEETFNSLETMVVYSCHDLSALLRCFNTFSQFSSHGKCTYGEWESL